MLFTVAILNVKEFVDSAVRDHVDHFCWASDVLIFAFESRSIEHVIASW